MDAATWQSCGDTDQMLRWLIESGKATDRKLRLFGCACCRRVWPLLVDERLRHTVEVAELLADGLADESDWNEACAAARVALSNMILRKRQVAALVLRLGERDLRNAAGPIAREVALAFARHQATDFELLLPYDLTEGRRQWAPKLDLHAYDRLSFQEEHHLCTLLRDIFHPFRKGAINSEMPWRDEKVERIAQELCMERDFMPERMGLLADALEKTGCNDEEVLAHCRAGGVHVLGCWVLDLILGKS